jgi:hypothetical protein
VNGRERVEPFINEAPAYTLPKLVVPPGDVFEPLMTLYLTHNTTPDNIRAAAGSGKKPTPEMLKQEKKIKAKSK